MCRLIKKVINHNPDDKLHLVKGLVPRIIAVRVTLVYLIVSFLWIFLSDNILKLIIVNKDKLTWVQTVKGSIFIIITSYMIFILIDKSISKNQRLARKVIKSNEEIKEKNKELNDIDEKLNLKVRELKVIQDLLKEREEKYNLIENRIYNISYYDSITGLPNRGYLKKQLKDFIKEAKNNSNKIVLMHIDLDDFGFVNESLGHSYGDDLLKDSSDILIKIIGNDGVVTRISEDEFAIIIYEISQVNNIEKIANEINKAFQKPWTIRNLEFYVTASIGIAVFPDHGEDDEVLLKNVNTAMHYAKNLGKNNYCIYSPSIKEEVLRNLDLERRLRYAVSNDEFKVLYQPQVSTISGKIVGLEALIRWDNPSAGMVSPIEFIPIAEKSGLIIQIGEWILRKVCNQIKLWEYMDVLNHTVSVNVSAKQLEDESFVEKVSKIIKETDINPENLEFEITESLALGDLDFTIEVLNNIKKLGIKIALDDFGTGYSSLNYLKKLPVDFVKIDKSFINDITKDCIEHEIFKSIVNLAHTMDMIVIAEGVETNEQLQILKGEKCDRLQGYLFSKPISIMEVNDLLLEKKTYIDK
ncbi:putative bifunctional diguanylate cyclase/phosphodiesterase [Sporosalibacterium faouarense]|uniref:putative bifunctional diguanylate cyclase/phosphodiesterase n=1 Tax=Sporosalibacterium faouarense TaxID=516123 RepID=UPI00141D56F8|nr:bifunctional diguanylate cyclase/phosphodiesterase [Sporosalibacterium faouarense]MTI46935.1 bifunctional diguanylate cyclase/phosphodiesterase [Bacillota bacterium]